MIHLKCFEIITLSKSLNLRRTKFYQEWSRSIFEQYFTTERFSGADISDSGRTARFSGVKNRPIAFNPVAITQREFRGQFTSEFRVE